MERERIPTEDGKLSDIEYFKPRDLKHIYNNQTTFIEVPYDKLTVEEMAAITEYVNVPDKKCIRIPMWDEHVNTYINEAVKERNEERRKHEGEDLGIGRI